MKIWKRIRQIAQRRQFERDLAEEVQFHREMAGAAFGSAALAMEESREVWGFGWLDSLGQDIRYALRGIRKAPAFALTVIATIGLGLGLNTTLFTVFNAYVLRPLPVHDPDSLYGFTWTNQKGEGHGFTLAEYQRFRESRVAFQDVSAFDSIFAALEGHSMIGQAVSGNYFEMLGAGTFLGRPLLPSDTDAIVLSYERWQELGADPGVVGKRLFLRGQPVVVAGVANPGFGGLADFPSGFWVPLELSARVKTQNGGTVNVVGRLQPGLTPEGARAGLLVWSRQVTADRPEAQKAAGVLLVSSATMVPFTRDALLGAMPVFAAFGLVLLIACVNVSNMMLARALSRQREIGIRVSLGAGRSRLIRQLMTESLLLALPAAVGGFAVSKAALDFATRLMYATLPAEFGKVIRIIDLSPDARVFGFILLASLGATVLFGLVPAVQVTRSSLVEANRGDFSNDYRPTRLRNALVVTQVAVCALLLICAGVVLRGELRVSRQDFGLDVRGVFDVQLAENYQERATALLRAQPDVEGVAPVWHPPLYGPLKRIAVMPEGRRETVLTGYNFVSPEYFPLFRIPVLRGRDFSAEEARSEAAVTVISESAARRLFPGGGALGQTVGVQSEGGQDPYYSRQPAHRSALVIGVARDVMNGWTDGGRDTDCLYFPTSARASHNLSLLVRANSRRKIEETLDRVAPSVADLINPMEEVLAAQSYPFRISFWVSAFLGGLALVLTVSGIYGVLSYLVSQRTREIGIRVALGAGKAGIIGMVIKQSMRLAAIGTVVGVGLALAVAPVFARAVAALNPFDLTAYAGCALVVMGAAVGAAFSPSKRAAGIDPAITLRND